MDNLPYRNDQINLWYISYTPQLTNAGLRFGLTNEEIKDLINQFFLDLLEKKTDLPAIENPQAYIGKSFNRRLIDYVRACKRKNDLHHAAASQDKFERSIADTLDIIQRDIELKNKIKKAYERLPERCKKVIYLKYYEGKTTEQIAEETNLSKRSVYNNLFEGIKLLRSEFAGKPDLSPIALLAILSVYCSERFM